MINQQKVGTVIAAAGSSRRMEGTDKLFALLSDKPVIVRVVARIVSRFGLAVTDKVAAEAVPVFGAAGGMTVNLLFIHHFQSVATGHFTVRRLERAYGPDLVKEEYQRLARLRCHPAN